VWTAEDEKSIQNIGSLELERNAAVEKLMSSRSMHRYYAADRDLIDLDLDGDGDGHQLPPGSAPSMHRNPFFFHDDQQAAASTAKLFSRHESFRPYFVADKTQQPVVLESSGGGGSSSSSSSSSSASGHRAGQHMKQEAVADFSSSPKAMVVTVDAELPNPKSMVTVDVELISDSSDDDDDDIMSLPGQQITKVASSMSDDDDGESSFEVESITRQVNETLHAHAAAAAAAAAAAREGREEKEEKNKLASIEEDERRERDVFPSPSPFLRQTLPPLMATAVVLLLLPPPPPLPKQS
jgi:hypothetical protein